MPHSSTLFQQLARRLQIELTPHLGSIAGMSEIQIAIRYRDVAWWLRSVKLATLPPGYEAPPGHLTAEELGGLGEPSPHVSPELVAMMNEWMAYECAWHLEVFINQLETYLIKLQAEEAARQLAQRQAEEAARLHAQRLAEEEARQLAQRQAMEAAQLAARQLAEQQAHAAAQALLEQKAQEAAIQAARIALELATAVTPPLPETTVSPEYTSSEDSKIGPARRVMFIPGPVAMAEIDRATLVLKSSIDAAVTLYASAIGPHLNTHEVSSSTML